MFWMEFINNPESEKIRDLYQTEEIYEEAKEAYYRVIADPEVQELLRIRDKAEKDYQDALARKKEEGENKKAVEVAKKMLAKSVDFADISEFTGLTMDEISKLAH